MNARTAPWRIGVLLLCAFAGALPAGAQDNSGQFLPVWGQPPNLTDVVGQLIRYHDYGQYDFEIRQVADAARNYLGLRVKEAAKDEKLAAVFDIDETSLSNWAAMSDCGLCSYKIEAKLYPDAQGAAIVPVLELFNFAKSKGVKAFFLTGRKEAERGSTIRNLTAAGYSGWEDLIMRPDDNTDPARVYKPARRQAIAAKGYTIVLNIGDQASDLAGCCAERSFKLPNPFYLIP
jgi:predicted secreted acid phosphatase